MDNNSINTKTLYIKDFTHNTEWNFQEIKAKKYSLVFFAIIGMVDDLSQALGRDPLIITYFDIIRLIPIFFKIIAATSIFVLIKQSN